MAGDDPEILAKLATLHNAVCEAEKALDDAKDALREGSKVYRDDVACAREDLRAAKHERDGFAARPRVRPRRTCWTHARRCSTASTTSATSGATRA